jgi:hypothetical protein
VDLRCVIWTATGTAWRDLWEVGKMVGILFHLGREYGTQYPALCEAHSRCRRKKIWDLFQHDSQSQTESPGIRVSAGGTDIAPRRLAHGRAGIAANTTLPVIL